MTARRRLLVAWMAAAVALAAPLAARARVEILQATGGLPAYIVGLFEEPVAFQQAASGAYFVFDRRAHAVYRVDPDADAPTRIVGVGFEPGRLLQPSAFDLRLTLNAGLPLAAPDGGYYFVFLSGVPACRKYAHDGRLVFERHIEGPEIDPVVQNPPTEWPRRQVDPGGELPFVPPAVRTAAVDPDGGLWVALIVPYTYVYDADGEKVRVVQFRAAGLVSPTSLFFADRRRLLVTPGCYEFTVR